MPLYEVLKSEKNRDVLLVDGYLFWFDRATPRGRKYWKCIYCYRSHEGDVKNRCISRVITSPGDPIAMVCKEHNHERDTMLVEHMKTFGSIRRVTSALRRNGQKENKLSPSSSLSIEDSPSTSEPLDLSLKKIPTRGISTVFPLEKPQKSRKRVLADVLETLYDKIQDGKSQDEKLETPVKKVCVTESPNSSIFDLTGQPGYGTIFPPDPLHLLGFPKQFSSWNFLSLQALLSITQTQFGSIDTNFLSK